MELAMILDELQVPISTDAQLDAAHRSALHEVTPPMLRDRMNRSLIQTKIDFYQKALQNPGSDLAYWTYYGWLIFWQTCARLHAAADIVGPGNLPDVEMPESTGALMDIMARLEKFGHTVFAEAAKTKE